MEYWIIKVTFHDCCYLYFDKYNDYGDPLYGSSAQLFASEQQATAASAEILKADNYVKACQVIKLTGPEE